MSDFVLHERLSADSLWLFDLELCQVRLINDATYPWVLLIPMRPGVREIFELSERDRGLLMDESAAVARALHVGLGADKINVAALGNMVPQLHVHHIARFSTDPAWPRPVWGATDAVPYEAPESAVSRYRAMLQR